MNGAIAKPVVGRRLTKGERRQALTDLKQWQSPEAMAERFAAISAIPGEYFFVHAGHEFIRDAYIAAEFAKARGASRVRLSDDPPDFEIEVDGVVEKFEATEADIPGRKRGDEYRAELENPQHTELVAQEVINAGIAAVPVALRAAAELKAAKAFQDSRYDPSWGLVILQNCATYGFGKAELEAGFDAATLPAKTAFRQVWVLWGREAYRTWPPCGPRPFSGATDTGNFDHSEIFPGE